VLGLCIAATAVQSAAFVVAACRGSAAALAPPFARTVSPVVVWTVGQGPIAHLARQTNRTADGQFVTLSTGVAFDVRASVVVSGGAHLSVGPANVSSRTTAP
jgi:hypothetical protein